jgi:hypothetical protein
MAARAEGRKGRLMPPAGESFGFLVLYAVVECVIAYVGAVRRVAAEAERICAEAWRA